ncbi:MAG: hypothetical protein EU535_08775 [Promethearchaeota archaeon]|nr:MAG: hypothetical protein EU535_08775 [Candidatus Lokiarchaeota archaeon]
MKKIGEDLFIIETKYLDSTIQEYRWYPRYWKDRLHLEERMVEKVREYERVNGIHTKDTTMRIYSPS